MKPSELLKLDDLAFLRAIVERYPETKYLIGKAHATPEGNPTLKTDALAYQVFLGDVVDPTAIEAERTLTSLLIFKWVLTNQYNKLTDIQSIETRLTLTSFEQLRTLTQRYCRYDEDLEFCLYSIACNDLGKTHLCVAMYNEMTKHSAADHDLLLYYLLIHAPQLFSAFATVLTAEQQECYIKGLGANLNLGQMVQGENFPFNLLSLQALDTKSRELRLICELFDFAGILGHTNSGGSLALTEENYLSYSRAIVELMVEPKEQAYQRYINQRGIQVGIDATSPEGFAQARLAAMARVFVPERAHIIKAVWLELDKDVQELLTRELNITGLAGEAGILIYYAPALIANAFKGHDDYAEGLKYALLKFAEIYQTTRSQARVGNGVITINVSDLAKEALCVPKTEVKRRLQI